MGPCKVTFMRRFLLLPLTVFTGECAPAEAPKTAVRPNIIYILADDLGYGDLSVQGQRHFETPNVQISFVAVGRDIRCTQKSRARRVFAPSRVALVARTTHRPHIHPWQQARRARAQTPIPSARRSPSPSVSIETPADHALVNAGFGLRLGNVAATTLRTVFPLGKLFDEGRHRSSGSVETTATIGIV